MADEMRGWALAGQLFGHLQAELGFGDLAMISTDLGPSVLRYVWEFKAGGRRYQFQTSVSIIQLDFAYDLKAWARSLSKKWKIEAQAKAAQ